MLALVFWAWERRQGGWERSRPCLVLAGSVIVVRRVASIDARCGRIYTGGHDH